MISNTSPSILEVSRDLSGSPSGSGSSTSLNQDNVRVKAANGSWNNKAGAVSMDALKGHVTGYQNVIHGTWEDYAGANDKVYKSAWSDAGDSQLVSKSVTASSGKLELRGQARSLGRDTTISAVFVGYCPISGTCDSSWKWETFGVAALSKGIIEIIGFQSGPLSGASKIYAYNEYTGTISQNMSRVFTNDGSYPYLAYILRAFMPKGATTGSATYNFGLKVWDVDVRKRA